MAVSRLLAVAVVVTVAVLCCGPKVRGSGVFRVRHRFADRRRAIADLRAHDFRRHGRALSSATAAVDLPIGGLGLPTHTGLYFARIAIGTPPKDYYVQVDTGSDILWVNCAGCKQCPTKSGLGVELTLYDPKGSKSGSVVTCDQSFCADTFGGESPSCHTDSPCQYSMSYGDGSTTSGFFVSDYVQYEQIVGDRRAETVNASINFGCGDQQTGDLGSSNEALDGILGFGQSNSSMISQLASAGKVKKVFSHCLDTVIGGGIFTIGHVAQPKVKTTPLVPNQAHYNVNLKNIEVGGDLLELPTGLFDTGVNKWTIIDSGTTLAYLPEVAYKQLMEKIFASYPHLVFHHVQDFLCFQYSGSVDDGFPKVTLQFEDSLVLSVSPHDYFFENQDNEYCVGWQRGEMQTEDGQDIFLLGGLVLSNKLVVYDLENQVIGWTDYNCSSSIKVQDDKTGAVYSVDAQNISFACILDMGTQTLLLLLTAMMCYLIY